MKISSIIKFSLLIMPIVFIFFHPISLASRRGYGKMMQIQMVWCRSLDVQILEKETLLGKVGSLWEKSILSAECVANKFS